MRAGAQGDRVTPPRSSIGPISLIREISIEVSAERNNGWRTDFIQNGEVIASDLARTEPWIDRRAPGRLAQLLRAEAAIDRKAATEALERVFADIRELPDGQALVSQAAARAIGATVAVTIELSDPPLYIIDLEAGTMVFSAKELARQQPITLNEKWLSVYPREPLNARGKDVGAIVDYWVSIAEETEPTGFLTPWEVPAEELARTVANIPIVHEVREGLIRDGLFLAKDAGILWIAGWLVQDVLERCGMRDHTPGFSQYLRRTGDMIHKSQPHRVGSRLVRAWGFRPDYHPGDAAGGAAGLPDLGGGADV